ncbi:MAG: hypothetical protein AAB380_01910, partial [Verrucomicrobiota bacterium]
SNGLCTRATGPAGATVDYSYHDGLLTGAQRSNGPGWEYGYTTTNIASVTRGWVNRITEANGAETHIRYEGAWGGTNQWRVARVTGPLGFTNRYDYLQIGTNFLDVATTVTNSLNQPTTFAYEDHQRIQTVENALGFLSVLRLNDDFPPRYARDFRGNTNWFVFDSTNADLMAHANLLAMTNALGNVWKSGYDTNNFQVMSEDPLGHTNGFQRGPTGLLLSMTNALNQQTASFSYTTTNSPPLSGGGLLASATDGRGNTTRFFRNRDGLATNVVDALSNSWRTVYHASGGPSRITAVPN